MSTFNPSISLNYWPPTTYAANDNDRYDNIRLRGEDKPFFIWHIRFRENSLNDSRLEWCKQSDIAIKYFFADRFSGLGSYFFGPECHYCFDNKASATSFVLFWGGEVVDS